MPANKFYTIHGVIDNHDPNKQEYRSYITRARFVSFLKEQRQPFVEWNNGCNGDILTVDDGTRAGADACLLARKHQHDVVFFINPYQVIHQCNYWFSTLNSVIDQRKKHKIIFEGKYFNLSTQTEVIQFRKLFKERYMCKTPEECEEGLSHLKNDLDVQQHSVAKHMLPITIKDIKVLINQGVQIESHGWSHIDIRGFTKEEFLRDLDDTADWLFSEFKIDSKAYAVPFGESDPATLFGERPGTYFLADSNREPGELSPGCCNRIDITKQLKSAEYDSIALRY